MGVKLLKVLANSFYAEHDESVDVLKMVSYSTANYLLTDLKLGHLIDGADAARFTGSLCRNV